jgi:hypothetical protein
MQNVREDRGSDLGPVAAAMACNEGLISVESNHVSANTFPSKAAISRKEIAAPSIEPASTDQDSTQQGKNGDKVQKPAIMRSMAARAWYSFGLDVIPIVRDTKQPAVAWTPWLEGLSAQRIARYWKKHPNADVGFIVGASYIVFDADCPASTAAFKAIEQRFGVVPQLVVRTRKGVHHFYRLAAGTFAKQDSHSTALHPDRIDIKTGRALVVLPPSAGRKIVSLGDSNAN